MTGEELHVHDTSVISKYSGDDITFLYVLITKKVGQTSYITD